MKYHAPVLAALITLATAQDLSTIPSCAVPCINDAVASATSCGATDVSCICKSLDAVTEAATGCVLGACGLDTALNEVIPATRALCANPPAAEPEPTEPAPTEPAPTEPEPTEPAPAEPAPGDDDGKDDEETPAPAPEPSAPAEETETPAPSSVVPSKSAEPPVASTTATRPPVVTAGAASFGASLALAVGVAAAAL